MKGNNKFTKNFKRRVAVAVAGVLGVSAAVPLIANSIEPAYATASNQGVYASGSDIMEATYKQPRTSYDYDGDGTNESFTVVRTAAQLQSAIDSTPVSWFNNGQKELVILVDNSTEKIYNDGSYDNSEGATNLDCFPLTTSIQIPNGKNIRLITQGNNEVEFVHSSEWNWDGPMFNVAAGGSLALDEHIVLSGDISTPTAFDAVEGQNATDGTWVCADGSKPQAAGTVQKRENDDPNGNLIYSYEKISSTLEDGELSVANDTNFYNSDGTKVLAVDPSQPVKYKGSNLYKVVWLDASWAAGQNKSKFSIVKRYKTVSIGSGQSITTYVNTLENKDEYMLVGGNDGNLYGIASNDGAAITGTDQNLTVDNNSNLRAHLVVINGEIRVANSKYKHDTSRTTESQIIGSTKVIAQIADSYIKTPVYYTDQRCNDLKTPTWQNGDDAVASKPAGKSYTNKASKTNWTPVKQDGEYIKKTGFFIYSNGNVTIDGATLKSFKTPAGDNHYEVMESAPVYIAGGKFVMNDGYIMDNVVGYNIQGRAGITAASAKNWVQSGGCRETKTAGAIIFAGGTGHEINGGSIMGNKGDTGAIIVTTDNKPNTAGTESKTTSVSFGQDTSKTPLIAGNIGIHDAGAVYIWPGGDTDTAEFKMYGGRVQDNFCWYRGGAFNVNCEDDPIENWGFDKKRVNAKAIFSMYGGVIDNNTATARAGAIEVMSDDVYLLGGKITNNNSRSLGGAIYVEGDFVDRNYTLYIPNGTIKNNYAWQETKGGREDNDYAYLKRLFSDKYMSSAIVQNEDGTYTYNNPFGNVRDANGEIDNSATGGGKSDWTADETGDRVWNLYGGRTGDPVVFDKSGYGGGIWLCALGGYAYISYLSDSNSDDGFVGASIDGNYGVTSGGEKINWDIHATAKWAGITFSKDNTPENSESQFEFIDGVNKGKKVIWNHFYSNATTINAENVSDPEEGDPTEGGTKGIYICDNNARNGGGIAADGTVIFGKKGEVYKHSAKTSFGKTWGENTNVSPAMFQGYIKKSDGSKVAVPGYTFILDGVVDSVHKDINVDEAEPWKATILLPTGYDNTPTFTFKADGKTYSTNDLMWKDLSATQGTIQDWNFVVEELGTKSYEKEVTSGDYILMKQALDAMDQDLNFMEYPDLMENGSWTASTDYQIPKASAALIKNGGSAFEKFHNRFKNKGDDEGLYFVKKYSNVEKIEEELYPGKYFLVRVSDGSIVDEFEFDEAETKYSGTNLIEKPESVTFSHHDTERDVKDNQGKIISKVTNHVTEAVTVADTDSTSLQMDNNVRTKPEVEKYINKKVDEDLTKISDEFTYDIIARVPDQVNEFTISDTLVDWIKYAGNSDSISLRVLDDNDHLGNGSGTVSTGSVDGVNKVNDTLTNSLNEKAEKIILGDTLTVKVNDKGLLNSLEGKYVQITVKAKFDETSYSDIIGKSAFNQRDITYGTATTGSYTIRNGFDKSNYTYRLYKVDDTNDGNLVVIGDNKAGNYLSDDELKALGVSADTKVIRSGRLGVDSSVQAGFSAATKTFTGLTAGKYVLHVMSGTADDATASDSKSRTVVDRCEVFEILDGKEDIRWVEVAGSDTQQTAAADPFKNDSPYMGDTKQQTSPQVITGDVTNPSNTVDDPFHDGVGNRASYSITYRGGRTQQLITNTVTVEPPTEELKIEKYVNKKVDDTLKGFDSTFTYDIMAYVPEGAKSIVINDELVSWLDLADTDASKTVKQIRVLNGNDHIGTGTGTVATGKVGNENKVTNIDLTDKYTVTNTNDVLTVTIQDAAKVKEMWGKWLQITFDAKIDETAYGNVVSKLNEKDAENSNNRASVTYSNSDTGTHTVNIKDSDKYYYRLYSKDMGAVSNFMYKRDTNKDWYINYKVDGKDKNVPEEVRKMFGVDTWTESARTLEFNSSNITTQIKNTTYRDYNETTGELTFKNLPVGEYFLYCYDKGNDQTKAVVSRCEAFTIDKNNFNWVEVDGDVASTAPEFLKNDGTVIDNSSALHDGIGNRAGYSVGYGYGVSKSKKTNVVTVEPTTEDFSITKVWEGDNVTIPSGDVKEAFLNALKLKLGGEDIPATVTYEHNLTATGTDTATWTISTPKLPTFEGKKYTLVEDLDSLKNSTNNTVKDFFKYYKVSYSNSVNDKEHLKLTDIVSDFEPDKYAYTIATTKNVKDEVFTQGYASHGNFDPVKDLLGGIAACSRSAEITTQEQFEALLAKLPTGDYVLLAQAKKNNGAELGRHNYDSVREKSAAFHYEAGGVTSDVVEAALKDEYGNSRLHDSVITITSGDDRKLLALQKNSEDWIEIASSHEDYKHINTKWGYSSAYKNDAYWGLKTSNDIVIDLNTLPSGVYFDVRWIGGKGWDSSYDRVYTVINSTNSANIRYSVYKKDGNSDTTFGDDLDALSNGYPTWKNGIAKNEATAEQRAYKKVFSGLTEAQIKEKITSEGDYIVVAENSSERIVPLSFAKKYNDGQLVNGGTIYNTRTLYNVRLRKTDTSGNNLTGATFKLYHYDNNTQGDEVTLTADSKNGAYFSSDKIAPGVYKVVEQEAPTGYTKISGDFTFTLGEDGKVSNITTATADAGKVVNDTSNDFTIRVNNAGEQTSVTVKKKWQNDTEDLRPESITIYLKSDISGNMELLKSDEHPNGEYVISHADHSDWNLVIDNLPKYVYTRNTDGSVSTRKIKYEVTEAPVTGYITGTISVNYGDETADATKVYYGASTLNESARYKINYTDGSYTIYTSMGGVKHTLTYGDTEQPAYCLNWAVSDPGSQGIPGVTDKQPLEYIKKEVSTSTLSTYINVKHNQSGNAFGLSSNATTYGNEEISKLYYRLMKILHYGYPNDANGFMSSKNLSEDEFRHLTANAIYEYTDWYDDDIDGVDYTDKSKNLFALNTSKGNQIHGDKLRTAYREFMNTIMTDDFSMVKDKQLYVYTPKNASDVGKYQNLFGVGEIENCAEITNTRLSNFIFRKTDKEGNPINHDGNDGEDGSNNAKAAKFKLVTALNKEQAIDADPIYESVLDTTDGNTYRFEGVAEGSYWLVETKAPEYYVAGEPVKVTVKYNDYGIAEVFVDDAKDSGFVILPENSADDNTYIISNTEPQNTSVRTKTYVEKTWEKGNVNYVLLKKSIAAGETDDYFGEASRLIKNDNGWIDGKIPDRFKSGGNDSGYYFVKSLGNVGELKAELNDGKYYIICLYNGAVIEEFELAAQKTFTSYCLQSDKTTPNGNSYAMENTNTANVIQEKLGLSSTDAARKISQDVVTYMYYGYGGSGYNDFKAELESDTSYGKTLSDWDIYNATQDTIWDITNNGNYGTSEFAKRDSSDYQLVKTKLKDKTYSDVLAAEKVKNGGSADVYVGLNMLIPDDNKYQVMLSMENVTFTNYAFSYANEYIEVELPHTGGIGTTIFYIIGGIAAAAAIVAIEARNRYKNKSNNKVA